MSLESNVSNFECCNNQAVIFSQGVAHCGVCGKEEDSLVGDREEEQAFARDHLERQRRTSRNRRDVYIPHTDGLVDDLW